MKRRSFLKTIGGAVGIATLAGCGFLGSKPDTAKLEIRGTGNWNGYISTNLGQSEVSGLHDKVYPFEKVPNKVTAEIKSTDDDQFSLLKVNLYGDGELVTQRSTKERFGTVRLTHSF